LTAVTLSSVLYAYAAERPALAGAAIALATLAKFNGVYALGTIVAYEVLRFVLRPDRRARAWRAARHLLLLLGSFAFVFLAVLWPLDRLVFFEW
jgi:4-amino-4-deoxy-L-arabinose transferase-like glycosyltransferase